MQAMSEQQNAVSASIRALVDLQKNAHIKDGPPSLECRIDRLDRAIALLVEGRAEIVNALKADFGHRCAEATLMFDVISAIHSLQHAKANVAEWMKAERRATAEDNGSVAYVEYQPLGVVGIISPWNFPVYLVMSPLASVFAAGNRAIIKPSELTPATSALLVRLFCAHFDTTEVAVVTGGVDVGVAFSRQPFDHLLFTGSTPVAHSVMQGAAENLVPMTLELGGKSPVIVSDTADLAYAACKIMIGKTINAGQVCLAPDYVFIPEAQLEKFISEAGRAVVNMFPTILNNEHYTSIINTRHFARLNGYVEQARGKDVRVLAINPAGEDLSDPALRKIAPTLLITPPEDLEVMRSEIFGPMLIVKTYRDVQEAIDYVNARPRPLALYYFGHDSAEQQRITRSTTSGGVTINDVVGHVLCSDLPLRGVGASGMGAYHGIDGFRNFSHAKAVFHQAPPEKQMAFCPPYPEQLGPMLESMIVG